MKKKKKQPNQIETFERLHNKPVRQMTRRELLAAGLINFSATVTLPSIMGMLAKSDIAYAQEVICSSGGNPALAPIVTLNLAGGAGLSANFLPQGQGALKGQLDPLSSYTKLALGKAPSIFRAFSNGAPFQANGGLGNGSQVLQGILDQTGGNTNLPDKYMGNAILNNTAFVGVCVRTRDDSSENPFRIDGMIAKAGRDGFLLPNLGRNRNMHALITPPTPLNVGRFEDITSALGVSGRLAANLNAKQQNKLFKIINNLSSSQTRSLASNSGGVEMTQLLQCAAQSNAKVVGGDNSDLNPLNDDAFAQIWGIDNGTSTGSRDFVSASVVYNVLNNKSGTASIELGGYDYHNGTRTTGEQRDLAAGEMIGKILASFAQLNQKAFLIVTTDGGVTGPSNSAGGPWTSDRGTAGMLYMMGYDPAGAPASNGFQLGYYNSGQGAEERFVTGGTVEKASAAMFANYLSFSNSSGLIEKVIPRYFNEAELDLVLKLKSRV